MSGKYDRMCWPIAILSFTLGLGIGGCGSAPEERLDRDPRGLSLLGEAQQAYRAGAFLQAMARIDSAAAYVPDLPDLWFQRGLVLADLYRFEASDSSFQRALELDPQYPGARFNMGHNAFRLSSNFAKDSYRDALRHYRAEEALLRKRIPGESHPAGDERALAAVLLQVGTTYWNLNEPDSALSAYGKAIEADSQSAKAHAWLAGAQRETGNLEDALKNARRAAELEPDHSEYRLLLGVVLREAGSNEEATIHLEEAARREPWNRTAVYNLGQAFVGSGRAEEAMPFLKRADSLEILRSEIDRSHVQVFQNPDDPGRWENYALLLHRAGRTAEARKAARVMHYLVHEDRSQP